MKVITFSSRPQRACFHVVNGKRTAVVNRKLRKYADESSCYAGHTMRFCRRLPSTVLLHKVPSISSASLSPDFDRWQVSSWVVIVSWHSSTLTIWDKLRELPHAVFLICLKLHDSKFMLKLWYHRCSICACKYLDNWTRNFSVKAAGVTQWKFSINMQIWIENFNSEPRCATSFIA